MRSETRKKKNSVTVPAGRKLRYGMNAAAMREAAAIAIEMSPNGEVRFSDFVQALREAGWRVNTNALLGSLYKRGDGFHLNGHDQSFSRRAGAYNRKAMAAGAGR